MFKLIDSLSDPIRLPTNDDSIILGNLVSIKIDNDVIFILSDYKNAFGVVTEKGIIPGYIGALCSSTLFQTDLIESDIKYNVGDLLYSNNYGILTTRKVMEDAIMVGHIIQVFEEGYIEAGFI